MEIRERVFKELVVVQKLGKITADENIKLAEKIVAMYHKMVSHIKKDLVH